MSLRATPVRVGMSYLLSVQQPRRAVKPAAPSPLVARGGRRFSGGPGFSLLDARRGGRPLWSGPATRPETPLPRRREGGTRPARSSTLPARPEGTAAMLHNDEE